MELLLPPSAEAPTLSPQLQAESMGLTWGSTPTLGRAYPTSGSVPGPVAAAEGEECTSSLPEGRVLPIWQQPTLRSRDTKQAFRASSKAAQTTGLGAAPRPPP